VLKLGETIIDALFGTGEPEELFIESELFGFAISLGD